ncbi:MAG: hypothetical protein Q7K57_47690 [Burkholderiaceae bacterium]|nr:hypothetical protein [Burkholderiaceae bacterium]
MKLAWKILIGLGVVLVVLSFGMDTTVSSGGGRVHNIGLQQDSQNILILGCFMFLAGIVLYAVKKVKQTSDDEAAEKAIADVTKEKVKQEVQLLGAEFGQAGRDAKDMWLLAWEKVRRHHVIAVGVVAIGLTLLNAPFLVTDYPEGVRLEVPVRLPIWAKDPLRVGRLIAELLFELMVMWFCLRKVKKEPEDQAAEEKAQEQARQASQEARNATQKARNAELEGDRAELRKSNVAGAKPGPDLEEIWGTATKRVRWSHVVVGGAGIALFAVVLSLLT